MKVSLSLALFTGFVVFVVAVPLDDETDHPAPKMMEDHEDVDTDSEPKMSKKSSIKTGLAFSGGGVRSTALCSGVLRRLLQKGVSIDYLSTVSGGGWAGAPFMDWKFHNGKKDDPVWHTDFFEHLRKNINAVCRCGNPFLAFFDGFLTIICSIFLSIGIWFLRSFAFVAPTAYIMDYLFGSILRNQFTCLTANANKSVEGISKSKLEQLCLPKFGPQIEELIQVFFLLFGVCVVFYYLGTLGFRRTTTYLLSFGSQLSGFLFAMTFLPWFLEVYTVFTPRWTKFFILALVSVIWLFIPDLRGKVSFFLLILVYAYFVKWRIFKTPIFGFKYTHKAFWIIVWACGILLWIHPYLGLLQLRGSHLYVEYIFKRALFFPKSKNTRPCSFCCQSEYDQPVTLADLIDVQPEYRCNVTVNKWRKYDGENEKDYQVLTLSPTGISRIDRRQDEEEFESKGGFVESKHITLSSAMATSAACVSYDLGGYEDAKKSSRELRVVLGVGLGNSLVAQVGLTKSYMSLVIMLILQLLFGLLIIGLPLGLYFGVIKDWEYWERLGLIIFILIFVLVTIIALLPTGYSSNGFVTTFIRWCIINIIHVRLIRILFGVTDTGTVPPPVLNLSDGGHVENLGLLTLFKLRLPRIVAVNGGAVLPGETYATALLATLKQAREKLRCSFTGVGGRDIEEDIRQEFVEKTTGYQPRSYRFKVQYYEKSEFEETLVGEGEVIYLMPRHPDDGIRQFEDSKWNDFDDDVKLDLDESVWGPGPALKASEVDRLTGCCCECCHSKLFNMVFKDLGRFPFHPTLNQMFTQSQFIAYHREGYRACVEGQAAEFLDKEKIQSNVVLEEPQPNTISIIIDPVD